MLWKKIARGLSAGRVQSPALRLLCEREDEIEAFIPKEYWSILAELEKDKQQFNARLSLLENEKVKQFTVTNGDQANTAKDMLMGHAKGKLTAVKVDKETAQAKSDSTVHNLHTTTGSIA